MRGALRRLILNSSVALAATLFMLLLLEAALRGYYHLKGLDINTLKPESALYPLVEEQRSSSHRTPSCLSPSGPGRGGSIKYYSPEMKRIYVYDYSLNSLGFLTPERPFEKPAGVRRIVILGGSTTIDGFTDPETWPARLERQARPA